MMSKYIEEKRIYKLFSNGIARLHVTQIDELPRADVTEVKRGEWIDVYGNKYDNHIYKCSVCGENPLLNAYADELDSPHIKQVLSPYCPNCGAKMEGVYE